MIYVVLQKTIEPEYGYGGYTGRTLENNAVLGYCSTAEAAQKKVDEFELMEIKRQKRAKGGVGSWHEFRWECISEL